MINKMLVFLNRNYYSKPKVFLSIYVKIFSVFLNNQDKRFNTNTIIDMVVKSFPDTSRESVIPSNLCYNTINADPSSFNYFFFEDLGRDLFTFLGADFPYSGPIYWKGKEVGEWIKGKYRLRHDPRK